jgi:hypothetical protein
MTSPQTISAETDASDVMACSVPASGGAEFLVGIDTTVSGLAVSDPSRCLADFVSWILQSLIDGRRVVVQIFVIGGCRKV